MLRAKIAEEVSLDSIDVQLRTPYGGRRSVHCTCNTRDIYVDIYIHIRHANFDDED